jgi:hypothetical protein
MGRKSIGVEILAQVLRHALVVIRPQEMVMIQLDIHD